MDLVEIIGFFISMVALLFLFLKQIYDEMYRRRNPEIAAAEEKKKQAELQKILRSLELTREEEMEEEKNFASPLKTIPSTKTVPARPLLQPHQTVPQPQVIEPHELAYEIKSWQPQPSRALQMVAGLSSPRNMLLFQEIMGKPLALRPLTRNQTETDF